MTDKYQRIRDALAMGPTPGPFSASRSYSPGNQELILHLTYKDEYGLPEHYCTVRSRLGGELGAEANAALIAACDPDTIRELLEEREALQAECERLRSILIDLKDWDCDVSGGFLSIPVDLRRRMQEALAAAPEAAGEPCRTINIEDINIDDIVAWADGVQGALGTEYADRVTEMEAAASRAVMTAIASAPDRCPHGVRRPHERKECADTVPASEALDWAEREFAAARQSPGEPGQVETPVKESLMTEQPAPDVTALVEESISVTYVDGVGAGRRSLSDCRDGVRYITIADTVYWPLSADDAQRLRSAECGRGDFTGPANEGPDVEKLIEALEQCITSMLDSGYRADAVVIRAARSALADHRKQGGEE